MHPERGAGAGWWLRLLVAFGGAVGIWLGLTALANAIFGAEYSYASHVLRAVGTFGLVTVGLRFLVRWEGASAASYGLVPDRGTPATFGLGSLSYTLPFLAVGAAVISVGAAAISVPGSPMEVVGQLLAVLVLVLLYEAIPEELIFRGYLYATLANRFPRWVAVLGQAMLFCLLTVAIGAVTSPERLLLYVLFAMCLGVIRAASGSVFVTIGFHTAFQFTGQPLLGSQWPAIALEDPDRWFADLALGLGPFLLASIVVILFGKVLLRNKLPNSANPERVGTP